jgi:teichuronic acid biosynthesis glycosyltransferase TuaC
MKILSLSCVFPNPSEPGLGPFVRSRLLRVADSAEVKVIAPVPLLDYSANAGKILRTDAIPYQRQDDALDVFHPRWVYPPFGGAWNPFFLFARLLQPVRQLRKTFRFDLIDAHFAYPEGIAAKLLSSATGIPFVVTLRGNEPAHAKFPLRRRLIRDALCRASRVITVSESLRQFAIELGVDPSKTKTIPNGIDSKVFHPCGRTQSRRKYGIPENVRFVLSAGALIERKGHHRVVQALKDLDGHDDVQL